MLPVSEEGWTITVHDEKKINKKVNVETGGGLVLMRDVGERKRSVCSDWEGRGVESGLRKSPNKMCFDGGPLFCPVMASLPRFHHSQWREANGA